MNPVPLFPTGPKGDPSGLFPAGFPASVRPFPLGITAYGRAFDLSWRSSSIVKSACSFSARAISKFLVASIKRVDSLSSLATMALRLSLAS